MDKKAKVTTQFSVNALLNTLNPLSGLSGGRTTQYVPKWLIDAIAGKNPGKQQLRKATQMANITAKTVGSATIAGTIALLARMLAQKSSDKDSKTNLASRTSGDSLGKRYRKKTDPLLAIYQPYQAQDEQSQDINKQASAYPLLSVALPTTASILTAMSVLAMTDKHMDRSFGRKLDQRKQKLKAQLDKVMLQRIARNRNVKLPQNTQQQQPEISKKASSLLGLPALQTAAGLIALALFAVGAKAGFSYDRQSNKDYLVYKARKKGLQTYVKARQGQQNTYHDALSPDLVTTLDSGLTGKAPQLGNQASYKQIDV